MPEEIIPGLYRLPIPLPNNSLGSVNVYAAVSADGLQLIDSGWNAPEVYIALVDELRELGMQVALPHPESDCAFFTKHPRCESFGIFNQATTSPISLGQKDRQHRECIERGRFFVRQPGK